MLKIPQIHAIFFKFAEFGKVRNSLERLYFKLINGWLNSKLCAKRKSLHSDENACVFFVKKET